MKVVLNQLKDVLGKLNVAVEMSKLNPKYGWVEIVVEEDKCMFKVSNLDYYFETLVDCNEGNGLHCTVVSDTFIALVSKLEGDTVVLEEYMNNLTVSTESNKYTIPLVKERGKAKEIDVISMNYNFYVGEISGADLNSVATINTKGLVDALYAKDIQKYIYMDECGALTFTENIYVNEFKSPYTFKIKELFTVSQAKLFELFSGDDKVSFYTCDGKVAFVTENVKLVLIVQDINTVDRFPSIRLRRLAENMSQSYVELDKKSLDKALARLMVFDKKFDITVLDYSKVVFKKDRLELQSIKNKNVEYIPYINSKIIEEHESMIRFADLVKQLKAVSSKTVSIYFGDRPAIIIDSGVKQVIPEIQLRSNV